MTTELKPCQCGCNAVEIVHIAEERQISLTCPKCGITISHKYFLMTEDELRREMIEDWNTRHTEDTLQSRITELEKALHIADEEYMCATSQYYNEPVPPSNYHRWLSLAIDPPKEEK